MRAFAIHDADGNIRSLIAIDGQPERRAGVATEPGEMVSEVDMPRLTARPEDDEQRQVQLLEVVQNYRVDVAAGKRKLIRRGSPGKSARG
jgi:hypothetical protein